ncbi:hypothetical protein HN358_03105 [Candidatus Uhrbacteria bacterium]|jgi:hypothetical protein|nr:hypothetical protein [Candidatus Uhrbacteria bacterium]MBT7717189.1 hypothetical protein [Candidatus Uhrbacteria bacterium]
MLGTTNTKLNRAIGEREEDGQAGPDFLILIAILAIMVGFAIIGTQGDPSSQSELEHKASHGSHIAAKQLGSAK